MREPNMRRVSLIPAIVAVFLSSAASAQVWEEYVNRDNNFQVNMPGEPAMTEVPYRTVKGTNLTARVFTAAADPNSITAGTYRVTVIDYSNAQNELGDAMEQARQAILAKGTVKYDDLNNLDFHRSRRITVENANTRILAEILISARNRLYIVEGETPLSVPPAAQFQASLQILNDEGVRIRERTEIAAPANEVRPTGERANNEEAARVQAAISGTWRVPGGSCQAAYFKSGERTKSVRGEDAVAGTVTNAGVTIPGHLIIVGPREGQFVNPMNDRAVFLFENRPDNTLNFVAIGAPAAGWPEVTLERCTG
jgi:hypothetical protein